MANQVITLNHTKFIFPDNFGHPVKRKARIVKGSKLSDMQSYRLGSVTSALKHFVYLDFNHLLLWQVSLSRTPDLIRFRQLTVCVATNSSLVVTHEVQRVEWNPNESATNYQPSEPVRPIRTIGSFRCPIIMINSIAVLPKMINIDKGASLIKVYTDKLINRFLPIMKPNPRKYD